MTIHVETPDHGTYSFIRAIGWQTCSGDEGDEGNLSILLDEDTAVAEFAKGSWLFVYEKVEPETQPKLRSWARLADVDEGVYVVFDVAGRRWLSYNGQTRWVTLDEPAQDTLTALTDLSGWGPFTEEGDE